jgi:hypothetical protein
MVIALVNALLAAAPTLVYVAGMFLSNVIVGWIALEIARSYGRREREKVEGSKTAAIAEAVHH